MSDSDKALLAAMAMRAKKNAIDQGKGLSVTAKVKALSKAGFTDAEIDRIIAVEAEGSAPTATDTTEYNQQVDETIQFTKSHIIFFIVTIIGTFLILFRTGDPLESGIWPILWAGSCFTIMFIRNALFTYKKADYFLKR